MTRTLTKSPVVDQQGLETSCLPVVIRKKKPASTVKTTHVLAAGALLSGLAMLLLKHEPEPAAELVEPPAPEPEPVQEIPKPNLNERAKRFAETQKNLYIGKLLWWLCHSRSKHPFFMDGEAAERAIEEELQRLECSPEDKDQLRKEALGFLKRIRSTVSKTPSIQRYVEHHWKHRNLKCAQLGGMALTHAMAALELYTEGDYFSAAIQFANAYIESPDLSLLYNIGQCYQYLGHTEVHTRHICELIDEEVRQMKERETLSSTQQFHATHTSELAYLKKQYGTEIESFRLCPESNERTKSLEFTIAGPEGKVPFWIALRTKPAEDGSYSWTAGKPFRTRDELAKQIYDTYLYADGSFISSYCTDHLYTIADRQKLAQALATRVFSLMAWADLPPKTSILQEIKFEHLVHANGKPLDLFYFDYNDKHWSLALTAEENGGQVFKYRLPHRGDYYFTTQWELVEWGMNNLFGKGELSMMARALNLNKNQQRHLMEKIAESLFAKKGWTNVN